MPRVVEIPTDERCDSCDLSVDFMEGYYCPISRTKKCYNDGCLNVGIDATEYIKASQEYKKLFEQVKEFEGLIKTIQVLSELPHTEEGCRKILKLTAYYEKKI